jgi:hypothetical protein
VLSFGLTHTEIVMEAFDSDLRFLFKVCSCSYIDY